MLQCLCVAVFYSVLQCVAVCCSALQCVAVCCSVLQCVAVGCMPSNPYGFAGGRRDAPAVCCSVLQCVAVCCSVLQCVAVRCSGSIKTQHAAVALTAPGRLQCVGFAGGRCNAPVHTCVRETARVCVCVNGRGGQGERENACVRACVC